LLAGVAAAVVGIIAATFVQLGVATAARVTQPLVAIALFAAALAVAWRVKGAWVAPLLLISGGVIGWLGLA
jgi:chromate transporter